MGGLGKWGSGLIGAAAVICLAGDAFPAGHHRGGKPARHRANAAASSGEEAGASVAVQPLALNQIHTFEGKPAPFALLARSEMLADAKTGTVLYSFNEHTKTQPASLAKIMTFYVTLDALSAGKVSLDTMVTVSEKAWRLSMDQSVSKMFLEVGSRVAVRDLLYGLMVSSGNDAAMALAEYLGGSSDAFVAMMNDQCNKLGLKETHFGSPDGLPVEGQYTTASDMVKLARIVVERHPEALTYTAAKEFTFHGIVQRNWNTLLIYDSRVNGMKTGHVAEAGFHLVATANSQGLFLTSALMGAANAEKRRTETEKLLDWAFRTFVTVTPQWEGVLPRAMRVYEGNILSTAIGPAREPAITLARGEENQIKLIGSLRSKYLVAPFEKRAVVGDLTVMRGDKAVDSIPIVTQSAAQRGRFLHVIGDKFRLLL
jgi:D-alanyl-D-alanine carboxypeptidase (penicillin-binding protein 5/6)